LFSATRLMGLRGALLQEALAAPGVRRLVASGVGSWLCCERVLPLCRFGDAVHVALRAGQQLALPITLGLYSGKHEGGCGRMLGRTRSPQMEARMVAADTPCRAVAAGAMLRALIVQLGAELVPELVTSTRSEGGISIVARSAGERRSRGRFARSIWRRK
jgi:hypothetical protein